jgi:LysM repeat protein
MRGRIVSVLVVVALTAACEVSGSVEVGKNVSSGELEKQVTSKLEEKEFTADSVSCPDGLRGKVDATTTCTVLSNDLLYTATVTATEVEGSTVSFDLKMPPPATVPKDSLAKQVTAALVDQVPGGVESVVCEDDLVGEVGETSVCDVTSGAGDVVPVTVTVTTATFTDVQFNIKSNE